MKKDAHSARPPYHAPLFAAARRFRTVWRKKGAQADRLAAAQDLLDAAVAWREAARAYNGKARSTRPGFRHPPLEPSVHRRPKASVYTGHLSFWASRYAWDKADGLDTTESRYRLLLQAMVGYDWTTVSHYCPPGRERHPALGA